jgi:hypothetical protein
MIGFNSLSVKEIFLFKNYCTVLSDINSIPDPENFHIFLADVSTPYTA